MASAEAVLVEGLTARLRRPNLPGVKCQARSFAVAVAVALYAAALTEVRADTEAIDLRALAKTARPAVMLLVVSDAAGTEIATGTGFLVSSDGKLITNHHVTENAVTVVAKAENGGLFPVEGVLADDPENDLVLLKVKGKDLPFLTLGTDEKVEVGARVAVIGSPFGLEGTLSEGIISAVREDEKNGRVIQITAAISPGSSGSPVLTAKGEVIGVASALLRGGQSLNFAAPVEYARALMASGEKASAVQSFGTITASELNLTGQEQRAASGQKVAFQPDEAFLNSVVVLRQGVADLGEMKVKDYVQLISTVGRIDAAPATIFGWSKNGYTYILKVDTGEPLSIEFDFSGSASQLQPVETKRGTVDPWTFTMQLVQNLKVAAAREAQKREQQLRAETEKLRSQLDSQEQEQLTLLDQGGDKGLEFIRADIEAWKQQQLKLSTREKELRDKIGPALNERLAIESSYDERIRAVQTAKNDFQTLVANSPLAAVKLINNEIVAKDLKLDLLPSDGKFTIDPVQWRKDPLLRACINSGIQGYNRRNIRRVMAM